MGMYVFPVSQCIQAHDARSQTTEDVEEAIKKGLPAERPVRKRLTSTSSVPYHIPPATQNRGTRQQVCCVIPHVESNLISFLPRYDLLCIEGISRALRVFLGKAESPPYRLVHPPGGADNLLTVHVHPDVRLLAGSA